MMNKNQKLFRRNLAVLLAATMTMSAGVVPVLADNVDAGVESQAAAVSEETSAEDAEDAADAADSTASAVSDSSDTSTASAASDVSDVSDSSDVSTVSDGTESEEPLVADPDPSSSTTSQPEGPKDPNVYSSADINVKGTVKMIRMYNPNSGEHFYTGNAGEARSIRDAGWVFEKVGWIAPESSDKPVYRLYNPNAGDHHYTMSAAERDYLVSVGWNDEGIGWYSAGSTDGVPVLRQYNKNAKQGSHNFTTKAAEDQMLASVGWAQEGIAWYAVGDELPKSYDIMPAKTVLGGIDYSDIYNYDHFIKVNADMKQRFGDMQDEKALEYFVNTAMWNGVEAKSGVNYLNNKYKEHRYKLRPELRGLDKYSSTTGYLIIVNLGPHIVDVYEGKQFQHWTKINSAPCSTGAAATRTPTGVFATRAGGYYFDSGSCRCFYFTPFNGPIYFHSILYYQTSTPKTVMDGRLGMNISHGCVRLPLNFAKYIYENFSVKNRGTTVVVI